MDPPGLDPEALPCGWLELAADGRVRRLNGAAARLVGREPAALVGMAFDRLLGRPAQLLYQSYLQPLLQLHGHTAELALALQHADGSAVNVLVYSAPLAAGPGAGIGMVLAPVQQRKRIEDELLRVKSAADQAPGLVFQMLEEADGTLHCPYVSAGVLQLYGVTESAAGLSAEALWSRIDARDRPAFDAARAQAAGARTVWRSAYRVHTGLRPGGEAGTRWHELHASARELPHGRRLWTGYVADISERRALDEAHAERDAARHAARARSEFLARANHELRTPLNGILGFAQLLAGSADGAPLAPQQQRALAVILESGRHLLNLVNQLLDLSRAEAGAPPEPLGPLSLAAQVRAACQRCEPLAAAAGVQVLDEVAAAGCVLADETTLGRVLDNLLGNAIKYNRRGGRVRLVLDERERDRLGLAISDDGPGLDEAQLAHLFEPFNRLGAERSGVPGTGLGLVITNQLVQLLGGELDVSSTPGVGSTFTVWLQRAGGGVGSGVGRGSIAGSAGAAQAGCAEASAPPAPPAPPASPASPRALNVLYVEDNAVNALVMEALVALRPQLRLRVVPRAAMALEVASREAIDLMLLDLHLPDASGTELLARLRALPGLQAAPAVLVTASATSEAQELASAAGFQACWTKPLEVQRTLHELDRLLDALAAR